MGLRADVPYIDSVKAQSPDTLNYTWGVALTDAEESEIDFRDGSLGPALVSDVIRNYTDANADTFAGDYVDIAGGIATFLFTQQVAQHSADLSVLFPFPSRLAVRNATYTAAQLQLIKQTISSLPAGTFNSVAVDVPTNTIRVEVPTCDQQALTSLAVAPADALYVYLGPPVTLYSHYGPQLKPFAGGDEIGIVGGVCGTGCGCTAGYMGFAGRIEYDTMITAGHCIGNGVGNDVYQGVGGPLIGPASKQTFTGRSTSLADAGEIQALYAAPPTPSHRITTDTSYRDPISQVQGQNQDYVNEPVCLSGARAGLRCTAIQSTDVVVQYPDTQLLNARSTSPKVSGGGDSGGPWYDRSQQMAMGIESGGDNTHDFYSQIYDVLAAVQDQIYTPDVVAVSGSGHALWAVKGSASASGQQYRYYLPESLGGQSLYAPSVVIYVDPQGYDWRYYIITGTDGRLWISSDVAGWAPLSTTYVSCVDNPAAFVSGSTLYVGCEGSADNALYEATATMPNGGALPTIPGMGKVNGSVLHAGPAIGMVAGAITVVQTGNQRSDGTNVWIGGWGNVGFGPTTWSCTGHPALGSGGAAAIFACNGSQGGIWYAINSIRSNGSFAWGSTYNLGGTAVNGPGATITGDGIFPGTAAVYVAGTDGQIWVNQIPWWTSPTGWRAYPGTTVSGGGVGAAALDISPGTPLTATVPDSGDVNIFFSPANSSIENDWYTSSSGWQGPGPLPGTRMSGTPLAAVVPQTGGTNVFFVGSNGAIMNDWYTPSGGWQGPGPLPGAPNWRTPLAAVVPQTGGINVFFVGSNGSIMNDWYTPSGGWQGPGALPGTPKSGTPLAAVVPQTGGINVFFVGSNGSLMNDWYTPSSGWQGPGALPGALVSDTALAAVVPQSGYLSVFFVSSNGSVSTDSYTPSSGWQGAGALPGTPASGTPLAAVVPQTGGMNVFFVASSGLIMNDWYASSSGWQGPGGLPGAPALRTSLAASSGTNAFFVASDGSLATDWYQNGWQGPRALPGTPP